ncbi:unnamed protein product, partial [Fusarium graminearum]
YAALKTQEVGDHGFENISYNKTILLRPCLWPR